MTAQRDESVAPHRHLWLSVAHSVTPEAIVAHAEDYFGYERGVFGIATRGKRPFVDSKHMVRMVLRAKFPKMPLVEIGRLVGDCDHSTVMASIKQHAGLMVCDKAYRERFDGFVEYLRREGMVNAQ